VKEKEASERWKRYTRERDLFIDERPNKGVSYELIDSLGVEDDYSYVNKDLASNRVGF
jgi:hypothetical protein